MKSIAIITARSGSKGLPHKNIKNLHGKPMMAYTIEACLKSGCFDRVHVSTDSEEYAKIAVEYGADVPFLRGEELASDTATTEDVIRFVLREYEKRGETFEVFAIMQPTSPLRDEEDIKNSFALMKEKDANSIIGVCEMEHSPLWSNTLPENLSMEGFLDKARNQNRQSFGTYYRINGAMYLVKTKSYTSHTAMYGEKSYAYVMAKEHSVDIDDEMDFIIAQAVMAHRLGGQQ
ncbi:MAG: acylneuraminate cytidylyltransferase family protein [Lachnospiraceae bacterium]|nr:acylneuraminate cytidylyltransferase family protein [Lachnospiraceae bacterium]